MAIFGLWDSDRLVDPFLLSVIGSLFGVQAFQLAPFHFRGFFIPFTPSVGRFRDGVLFDSVPFLGFSFPRILISLASRWKDFYYFFLGPPGLLFALSEDVFAPGFLGFFFSLVSWSFWILSFYF